MADKIPNLIAMERTGSGKGAARKARREGNVPGVVYGGGVDPLSVQIPFNDLLKKLKDGRFLSTLFNLKVEGQDDVRVICRNVQRDVVKDLPMHFDLLRLKRNTRISLFIPLTFTGEEEAPGIKQGGFLTVVRPEIELNVVAGNIPEEIVIDISAAEIGDTVSISDVTLPEGAKPTIDRDFVIANIAAPTTLSADDEDEEDGEDTEAAEGEEAEGEGEEGGEE